MGGGVGSIPGTAFGGATDPGSIEISEGFRIIPTITAAERYDSNVFFQPKTPGVDSSDYVSTISPQIRGLFAGREMTLNAIVGASASYFVKNTNFNYVAVNGGLSLNLGSMLDRLWRGIGVTVNETFLYTPQPPSFWVGNQTGDTSNPYTNGQQVGRVSSTSNNINVSVTAPLTQTLSLIGSYSNGFLRFGKSEVQQAGALLNTSFQSFNVGMSMQLSPQDSMSLTFNDSEYRYEQATGGSFSTRAGMIGWNHQFNPAVKLTSSAGAAISEVQSPGLSNGQTTTTVSPQGRVALVLKDSTTMLSMAYGLAFAPAYQFGAAALLTNTVSLSMTQETPIPRLVGVASFNYGRGDQIGSNPVSAISYKNYMATAGISYKLTPRTFLNLSYLYSNYDNQSGAMNNSYDRQVLTLNLAQAFY
jgi:opacity protein-like surface antigen